MAKTLPVCLLLGREASWGAGWSLGEEKVKALCGKWVGDKGALSVLEGRGGEEGQAFISWDLVLPLAPGTFLGPESWEG